MEDKKVYEILLRYSTDENAGVDSFIFESYEKAIKKFNEIIEEEKTYIYWIKNAFESEENLKDFDFDTNIEIEYNDTTEHELYWEITNKYDWYQHDFLELRIKELK